MMCGERWLSLQLISGKLGLNQSSIRQLITEDLGSLCKDGAMVVPHLGSSSTSSLPSFNLLFHRKLLNETKSAPGRLV